MTNLSVIERQGALVVDSRLIAQELGIQHKNFLSMIDKYLEEIEEDWGTVAFETREFKTKQGNISRERWAWLTEQQSQLLMTYSKNTDVVRRCKRNLVKSFEKAKQIIKEVIPAQSDRIRELELEVQLAQALTQKALAEKSVLDTRHLIVATCPEPVQQKILGFEIVKEVEYRDRVFKNEQLINEGDTITKTELCHRYGFISKTGKPDYKKLNLCLSGLGINSSSEMWKLSATIQENLQFRREYLTFLDKKMLGDDRQMYLGEPGE